MTSSPNSRQHWTPSDLIFGVANRIPFLRGWLDRSAQNYARLARTNYESGDYSSAISQYHKALLRSPNDIDLINDMAQVCNENGQPSEAELFFGKALNVDYFNQRALKGLGMTLHQQNKTEDAIYIYLRYLDLNPEDYDVLVNLGAVFHDSAQFEEAIEYSQRGARANPLGSEARQNLASSYYFLGKLEEAEASIREAIALIPNSESYQILAITLEAEERIEEGLKSYLAAIDADPNSGYAHLGAARLLDKMGKPSENAEHIELAVDLFKKAQDKEGLAAAYWGLGWAFYELGDWDKSATASNKALEIEPNSAPPRFNLGLALLQSNKPEEAKREYLRALRNSKPSDLKKDAIDDLESALQKNPQVGGGKEILDILKAEYKKLEIARPRSGSAR